MERTAEQILKDRYKKQNEYNKANYQRITIMAPLGTAERIKALGVKSVSKFILDILTQELERLETPASGPVQTWETLQAQETKHREKERAEIEKAQAAPADHGELATAFMQKPITQTEEPHELTEDQKQAQAIIDEARKTAGLYAKYRT